MGRFVNGRVFNVIAWLMVAVLILLTVILIVLTVFPDCWSIALAVRGQRYPSVSTIRLNRH